MSPTFRRILNTSLLGLVIGTSLAWAVANISVYNAPGNLMDPFTDAMTYRAAGDRLNIGHDLYRLVPGDLPVLTIPGLYSAPLLSPPPIAVIWRPIAAVDWGIAVWVAAAWIALLGTTSFLVLRSGPWAAVLAFVLSFAIGEQLAVANVNAFMPLVYVLIWRYRDHAWIGALIALVSSIKLAPVAMVGWLIGTRRWKALVATVAVGAVIFVVGGVGAGFNSYVEYLGTLGGNNATALSLSGQTGWSWASYAFLFGGTLLAILAGPRHPTASWAIALVASVLGTPALYASGLVSLMALASPMVGRSQAMRLRPSN